MTGSEKAFAAGADIKEMQSRKLGLSRDLSRRLLHRLGARHRAVPQADHRRGRGFALGGGCELAMMCDFIIAADNAKFGQPEINLGVIPGIGGTQRLTRCDRQVQGHGSLPHRPDDGCRRGRARGPGQPGIPAADLMTEVLAIAAKIAGQSPLAVAMNKELVLAAYETTLTTGVALERRLFHSLFAFEDQKEGMAAFVEKRKPDFKGR
jgi:enoyl-CoA hydratase/carnithine racemase